MQLFSSCLYVGLRYPTTGQPPLPAGLEEGRLGSSGQFCHLERGHQFHMSHPWPWPCPGVRQLQSVTVVAPDSSALQEKG